MRLRTSLGLLLIGCTALAACSASAPRGPATAVTRPKVGHPAPPTSVQAALSSEAFTPYAALGLSENDGLAPRESTWSMAQACMAAAGYANVGAGVVPFGIRIGPGQLAFSQDWGPWGYLGAAEAQQSGFLAQPGSALTQLGIDFQPTDPSTLPKAEQTAALTCGTIVANFSNAVQTGPLATISTLNNDIANDVANHPAVKKATAQWSACMARNGYHYSQPAGVFIDQMHQVYGGQGGGINIAAGQQVSPAANQSQITAAVTDSTCTLQTDLAGIYFAVQASYEKQLVNANEQALTADVRRYRAAYARELTKLPKLLKTTKPLQPRTNKQPSPSNSKSPG
jgi:hypothetical protein